MRFKGILYAIAGAAAMLGLLAPASAEVPEIRLAQQFSIGYLQLNVMEHRKLIEKHAKLLGIPEVKVSWLNQRAGGDQRRAVVGYARYRVRRRAGPLDAMGEDQGHAAGSARYLGAELAAVFAQQPRP